MNTVHLQTPDIDFDCNTGWPWYSTIGNISTSEKIELWAKYVKTVVVAGACVIKPQARLEEYLSEPVDGVKGAVASRLDYRRI